MYKKKKKPLTTHGWLNQQAEDICARIDEVLEENGIDRTNFKLIIAANVIRSICNLTIINSQSSSISKTAPLTEGYNPFDNKSYLDWTQKYIMKKYGFKRCIKLPNVREYEFTF